MKGLTNAAADGIHGYQVMIMVIHAMQVYRRKKKFILNDFNLPSLAEDFLFFL